MMLTLSCTTNEFDSEGNPNPIFGDSYVIEIKVQQMSFVQIPPLLFQLEHLFVLTKMKVLILRMKPTLIFLLPSDYDPIVLDYYLEMPTCFNADAKFVLNSIVGGGCADNSAFYIYVQANP